MEPKSKEIAAAEKKTYEAPELIVHGDVEELTQFLAGGADDGDGGVSGPVI